MSGFIRGDLLVDELTMRSNIGPGAGEILDPQRRIGLEQIPLAGSQSPRLLKQPNGNPSPSNARFATAYSGP